MGDVGEKEREFSSVFANTGLCEHKLARERRTQPQKEKDSYLMSSYKL